MLAVAHVFITAERKLVYVRTATKIPTRLSSLPYEKRLRELGLVTLEERRQRRDIIVVHVYCIQERMEMIDRDLVIRNVSD